MLQALISPIAALLDKFISDKDQKIKLAHELATMADRYAQEVALAQIAVNKAEAESPSIFKGGWRPFIGWVCGGAFAYHFILQPMFEFALLVTDFTDVKPDELPKFDMSSLLTVLLGMLGLGGLRTYEKRKECKK